MKTPDLLSDVVGQTVGWAEDGINWEHSVPSLI